jgi:hypothetical protein
MTRLTSSVGRLGLLAFLFLAGGALAGPTVPPCAACSVAMPEPSFPLELIVTVAGSAGLVFWLRRRKAGPSQNR